jgi:hypothetical protein
VSDLEWWLKYGWYRLGVEDFAPVLVLTAIWLLVTVELAVFHRAKTRHGRGIVVAVPLIAWALFGFRQAINATQIDMAGSYTRYPYYWLCVLTSALVGAVVAVVVVVGDRLLTPTGMHKRLSPGVAVTGIVGGALWVILWIGVFVREASLPPGAS